jgi:cytidylate kinase
MDIPYQPLASVKEAGDAISSCVIAIDGPAGAGKSTVARRLALRLGFQYVDSGATYRAAALKLLESGMPLDDEVSALEVTAHAMISLGTSAEDPKVWLDGRDVTSEIRTPQVSLTAARISRLPTVRQRLVQLQRQAALGRRVVMEGRDIGTVVFPDSPLKIFLTADPLERARRRLGDDRQHGSDSTLERTAGEIQTRDRLDANRQASPLVPAPDAIHIDSTYLNVEEVVEKIAEIARDRGICD